MTLAKFARMCEILENQTPTQKAETISTSLSGFSDKVRTIQILSLEYPVNNIGSKRAITWIASALGIFEEELESEIYTWGEIGEALEVLDSGNEIDSDITIKQLHNLLCLDCRRINSDSYTLFSTALNKMSAREKKWFVRYWMQKPRNGVNNKVPLKAMHKHYRKKYSDINKYSKYNESWEICSALEEGVEPECKLTHGLFLSPMLAKARKGLEKPSAGVIIFNRKGKIVTDQYPDIVEQMDSYDVMGIFDSEIYPIETSGEPAPHKMLAKRVHMKNKEKAVEQCQVKLAIFDLLHLDGKSFVDEILSVRLEELKKTFPSEVIATSFEDTTIKAAYNLAIDWGFEGIMIKDLDATYDAGKRSKAWLKYKPPRISLDVVITSGKYGEGKRSHVFGTFGISVKDDSEYVSVGKIGTGFSDEDLDWLTYQLRQYVDNYEGDTFTFLPRIVLEVTSDLVTQDSEGNIGLRFPRCVRIRHDKYAAEVDSLQRVQEML